MKLPAISYAKISAPLIYLFLFPIGAIGYYSLELAFRGRSHWSMAICGGLCICLIYVANRKFSRLPLLLRALIGSAIITAVEFVAGCILNLWLGWGIWSYAALPFNFLGQIAPAFSALWFLLCIPVCLCFSLAQKHFPRLVAKRKKAE